MKLKFLSFFTALFFIACGTSKEQVKAPPQEETLATTTPAPEKKPEEIVKADPTQLRTANQKLLSELNQKLATATMSGFANAKVALSPKQEKAWLKKNLSVFKQVTQALPKEFTLEAQGHATSLIVKNPKYAVISREEAAQKRAEYAIDLLQKNGVDTSNMKAISKSDREPIKGRKPTDPANRRVTFKVVED